MSQSWSLSGWRMSITTDHATQAVRLDGLDSTYPMLPHGPGHGGEPVARQVHQPAVGFELESRYCPSFESLVITFTEELIS